jgi:uncharacterized protein HemY
MATDSDEARQAYEAGRLRLSAGDYPGAIRHLDRAAAALPHFKTLELLGEALLLNSEPAKAIVPLAAATTLNSQVRAPSLLAEALLKAGDPIQAHQVATLALQRDPKNRRAKAVFDSTLDEWARHEGMATGS